MFYVLQSAYNHDNLQGRRYKMAFLSVNFHSDVLGMAMTMNVILPQSAKTQIGMASSDGAHCKTLFLLHGLSDDHTIWSRRTSIERYVAGKNIAVVMPAAHKSWYTDAVSGDRYMEYISKEIPAICRAMFRQMSDRREDNYIAGLSMGGYGALKIALAMPEAFAGCAGLSGAYDVEKRFDRCPYDNANMVAVFGSKDNVRGSVNDVFSLAKKAAEGDGPKPRVYLWCGTEDSLYPETIALGNILKDGGFDLSLNESPGRHEWFYWDREIAKAIDFLMKN